MVRSRMSMLCDMVQEQGAFTRADGHGFVGKFVNNLPFEGGSHGDESVPHVTMPSSSVMPCAHAALYNTIIITVIHACVVYYSLEPGATYCMCRCLYTSSHICSTNSRCFCVKHEHCKERRRGRIFIKDPMGIAVVWGRCYLYSTCGMP